MKSAFVTILLFLAAMLAITGSEPLSEFIVGRWEGRSGLIFREDQTCSVQLGEKWINGVYSVSTEGKISVQVKGEEITLNAFYIREGERLTDGVMRFEGKWYWRKVGDRKAAK